MGKWQQAIALSNRVTFPEFGLVEKVPDVGELKLPSGLGYFPPCRVVLKCIEVDLKRVRNSPFG